MAEFKPVEFKGDYINGHFTKSSRTTGTFESINPGNTTDVIGEVDFCVDHVEDSIHAAVSGFRVWKTYSPEKRIQFFLKYKEKLIEKKYEIAELISRENGKPLWESEYEVTNTIEFIDAVIDHMILLVRRVDMKSYQWEYRPRGTFLFISPYNCPFEISNRHIVPTVMVGNSVVYRPHRYTPFVGQKIAEIFDELKFPEGVFNMIQGDEGIDDRAAREPDLAGIVFVGPFEVSLNIRKSTSSHYAKSLIFETGGKNSSIIMDDANIERAVDETLLGSFMTAGQRNDATSRIILHNSIADRFLDLFINKTRKFKIGYAFEENPFMGPLINASVLDKHLRFQGMAEREGAETIRTGKIVPRTTPGNYVSPSIHLFREYNPSSVYQNTELFSPAVSVYRLGNIDEAINLANSTSYGLVASIFTQNKTIFDYFYQNINTGTVNWNYSTVRSSTKIPIRGLGKSGSGITTSLFSIYYATYPVSSLKHDETDDANFRGIDIVKEL